MSEGVRHRVEERIRRMPELPPGAGGREAGGQRNSMNMDETRFEGPTRRLLLRAAILEAERQAFDSAMDREQYRQDLADPDDGAGPRTGEAEALAAAPRLSEVMDEVFLAMRPGEWNIYFPEESELEMGREIMVKLTSPERERLYRLALENLAVSP